jgi:phosphoglycolate phosphatase
MAREVFHIEAIIFDYDGTLVQLNIDFEAMRRAVEAFCADYGVEPGQLKGRYILEMIDEAAGLIAAKDPSKSGLFYRRSLERVAQCEVQAAQKGRILPGVTRMLNSLRARGVKVGVITRNCDSAVRMVFPKIESYCDVFLPREYTTRVKPHPDHLALALEKLSIMNKTNCFMVGDHILDIEAGKRMEMKTAGVLTGKTTRQHFEDAGADLILDDATKIIAHIFEE